MVRAASAAGADLARHTYVSLMATAAARLASAWSTLSGIPGGRRIFELLLHLAVPYSATVRPRVIRLEPGRATLEIRERRRLRNHLRSIHAIALANVGELSSGLAMTLALPANIQGIPVRIEVEYLKKARGRVRAEGRANPPATVESDVETLAVAELFDRDDDLVARVVATWRLRPA